MTIETKVAKNTLGKGMTEVKTDKKPKTIFDVIKAGEKNFAAALPKHVNSERFVRIALTQIRQNPQLATCSQESLLGALMTLAQLGLEPGVLGQAYLLPFKNRKLGTTECQLQISYKGMIELLRRSGQLSDIYAYAVYENDEFSLEYGLNRSLIHKPNFKEERGEITGFYSVALLKDGTKAFEFMTKTEIFEHEKKYRLGQYKNGIWDKNFEEMALKTVTKKMLKWLPISVEMIENIRKEDNIHKLVGDKIEEENIYTGDFENISEEIEVLATKEEVLELLANANVVNLNLKKISSELHIDFENMTKPQLEKLQNVIDEKTEE
ncbi:MAG: recombinase RecT, partial [Cetobacterium sp.]